jgi:hypothetical protein
MGCTGIEKDDDRVAIEKECTREDMSVLKNILHGGVVHLASLGSNIFPTVARMTLKSRRINLSSCRTFLGKMTTLTTVVAGAGDHAHLLQWWGQHGRWGCHISRYDIRMRWWTSSQLMMVLLWSVVMWSTYHPVLVRSTASWGCRSLLLLAFSISTDGIICNNGIAHKFQESPIDVEREALLKLGG